MGNAMASNRKILREAIVQAFDHESLRRTLAEGSPARHFDTLVSSSAFDEQVSQLIDRADKEGWLGGLLGTLLDARAANQAFVTNVRPIAESVAARHPLDAAAPSPGAPAPRPSDGTGAKVLSITVKPSETSASMCRIQANVGSETRQLEVEILPPRFKEDVQQLEQAILQSEISRVGSPTLIAGAAARLTTGADQRIMREIGSQLFKFMFKGIIHDLYTESWKDAHAAEKPLLIRLRIEHPELSYVPWETIYDEANRSYIATNSFTPLTRLAGVEQEGTSATPGRPIRILGMAARVKTVNGIPVGDIDADAEKTIMGEALKEVRDQVKVIWTPSARVRDLGRWLARGDQGMRWDIFHFIGHGGFDDQRGMGFIIAQEEGGVKGVPLYSENLRELLAQPQRAPKLVVLNSCEGARSQPGDLFASVAADLICAGIPAVVAMQFEISNQMGIDFSDAFYAYLAAGKQIQDALAITRAELRARGCSEWVSPVLYMRDREGVLFSEPATPSRAN